jgi:hypothetical protein
VTLAEYYGPWAPNHSSTVRYLGGIPEYPSVGTRLRRPVPIPSRYLPPRSGWRRVPAPPPFVVDQARWLAWHDGIPHAPPPPTFDDVERQRAHLSQEA